MVQSRDAPRARAQGCSEAFQSSVYGRPPRILKEIRFEAAKNGA